jgi:regulator of protease activity HflC (stomatin/prohibitin superfamily)
LSITRRFIVWVKNRIIQKEQLSWSQEKKDDLIYKFPNEMTTKIDNIGEILVKQGQRVALYKSGVFQSVLQAGLNRITAEMDTIYFVDVTQKKHVIGIRAPDYPITKDNISFGFSGNIVFKIMEDPVSIGNFLTKIVTSKEEITTKSITLWLRDGLLFQVFKEIIKNYEYEEFQKVDKFELDMNIQTKLGFELNNYGIEVTSLEIKNYTPPKKF